MKKVTFMNQIVAALIGLLLSCGMAAAQVNGAVAYNPGTSGVVTAPPLSISGINYGVWQATVQAAGTGYVPGNTYVPTLPGSTTNPLYGGAYAAATLVVASTQVVSATVTAGGTGCTNGTQTVTGTTGNGAVSGTYFTASVTVAGNAITAVLSITSGGAYQVNPTTLTAEPVTGASCSGSTLNVVMGALYVNVQNPGSYSQIAANPTAATQASTSGSGTGATLRVSFATQSAYVLPPGNSANGSAGAQASFNQFMGYQSGFGVTSGTELTGFGWRALNSNTTGSFNTAFGVHAGGNITTGGNNTCFGVDACETATTNTDNTCFGEAACQGTPNTALSTTAIGSAALTKITSGSNNSAFGYQAGFSTTTSPGNVFFGYQAGSAVTTGNGQLVLIGQQTGQAVTTAQQSVMIGSKVGSVTQATGSNNILIGNGNNCDTPASNTSNYFAICSSGASPLLSGSLLSGSLSITFPDASVWNSTNLALAPAGTLTNPTLTFTTCGTNCGILAPAAGQLEFDTVNSNSFNFGVTNAGAWSFRTNLFIANGGQININAMTQSSAAQSGTVCYNLGTGAITYDATVGCLTSTLEAKNDWQDIAPDDALSIVTKLRPGSYTYKLGMGLPTGPQVGFAAQQVAAIDDRLVGYRPDGDLAGVRYQQTSALYAGAIAALETKIENQQREIDALRNHH